MIAAIVQARMGSERLPGKVLKPILDKPIILHVLDRLKRSEKIDTVILATSVDESNDELVEEVEAAGYTVYRGSEDDVLGRYLEASELCHADTVVRVTGDCPLIDPVIVDDVISRHQSLECDYTRLDVPETFVRGFDVEVVSRKALEVVAERAIDQKYREHVTYYIYTHQDQFSIEVVKGDEHFNKPYRLCIDNWDDYDLVTNVFLYFNDPYCRAHDIIQFLDTNPHVAAMNADTQQKEVK